MGRFINADTYASTGQGILGNNMFAYCNNNPILYVDPFGNISRTAFFNVEYDANSKSRIIHDVPLFDQGTYSLCWAFCQIMIEDYNSGANYTNDVATQRAIDLAKSVNGEKNIFGQEKWNRGAFPTNLGERSYPKTIEDLYALLQSGPVYAFYSSFSGRNHAHMVVIAGVDTSAGLVYVNNPWGMTGPQAFEEFLSGWYGTSYADYVAPLRCVYPAI